MSAAMGGAWRTGRLLFRRPAFLVLGSAVLAAGVAALFTALALVDGLLLTPLPFANHASVVLYGEQPDGRAAPVMSATRYAAVGVPQGVLSRGLAHIPERASVSVAGRAPTVATVQRIDDGFMPTLGVSPVLSAHARIRDGQGALVSWRFWHDHMAGAAHAPGQWITVDGRRFAVAGVLPPAFRLMVDVDVWLPWQGWDGPGAGMANFIAVARLAPGANMAGFASVHVDRLATSIAAPDLALFLACAVLVMAASCANLSNMMLARALGRTRETVLRLALGAGWRTWSPAFVEATAVWACGSAGGLLLGQVLLALVRRFIPDDWQVLAATSPVSERVYLAVVAVAGLAVAVASLGGNLHEFGHASFRAYMPGGQVIPPSVGARRWRSIALQAQVALATMVLVVAVSDVSRLWRLHGVSPGFGTSGMFSGFRPDAHHFPDAGSVTAALADVAAAAGRLPDVASAGVSSQLPVGTRFVAAFQGAGGRTIDAQFARITPGARAAMGLRLLAGRDVVASDTSYSDDVVLVNPAFLHAVPGAVLGARVTRVSRSLGSRPMRIVGIVADTRNAGPAQAAQPFAFAPVAQMPDNEYQAWRDLLSWYVVARTDRIAGQALPWLPEAVRSVARHLAVDDPKTLAQAWHASLSDLAREAWLATALSAIGVGLCVGGLYSAQLVDVMSRRRELALIAALGASPGWLLGRSLTRGVRRALTGVALGMACAQAWRLWLPGPFHKDVGACAQAWVVVALVMLVVACVAVTAPALRAAATRPWQVSRTQ